MKGLDSEQTTKNHSVGSRNLFRPGSFLVVTALGLAGVLCSCWIAYIAGQYRSSFALPSIFAACGFMSAWWLAFAYREEVRELFMGGSFEDLRPGTPVTAALELALRTLNSVLFYCFVTNLALLAFIWFLLRRFAR